MKRQLLDGKLWMIFNKRTNWVPTFKRVEICTRERKKKIKEKRISRKVESESCGY
jgi:hypothetical protein